MNMKFIGRCRSRLRQLRDERNMRSLATASGLSANALSMIERGKTHHRSARCKLQAMGFHHHLFGNRLKQQVIFTSGRNARVPFSRGGIGGAFSGGRAAMLTLEMAPERPHTMALAGYLSSAAPAGIFVEKEIFTLGPGDSLLFAAQLNRWRNPGGTVTNALIVLSGFSEDEQPHVMHWKKS
jgi:hypothetical protein